MSDTKEIKLGDLFNDEQLNKINLMVNNNKMMELRTWLNTPDIKLQLDNLGAFPDYIYYCILSLSIKKPDHSRAK